MIFAESTSILKILSTCHHDNEKIWGCLYNPILDKLSIKSMRRPGKDAASIFLGLVLTSHTNKNKRVWVVFSTIRLIVVDSTSRPSRRSHRNSHNNWSSHNSRRSRPIHRSRRPMPMLGGLILSDLQQTVILLPQQLWCWILRLFLYSFAATIYLTNYLYIMILLYIS